MTSYKNNELHLHTDASLADGAQTVTEAVDAAIEAGAEAVAITDHGVCANWVDFYNYCNGEEVDHKVATRKIKPILGVEAYIVDEEQFPAGLSLKPVRQHLILLAKNYEGLQEISRFVTETNRNLDEKKKPIGTFSMLKKFFGNGNVVCTSACMAGVVATPLRYNDFLDKEISKVEKRIAKSYATLPEEIAEIKKSDEDAQRRIDVLKVEIDALKPLAEKTGFAKRRSVLKKSEESNREELLEQLNAEELKTREAKDRTKILREEIAKIKAEDGYKENHALCMKNKPKFAKIDENQKRIKCLEDAKKSENVLVSEATDVMKRYKTLFGDDFYAEVQFHGIEAEQYCYPRIASIAKQCGIKLTAANDVHFAKRGDEIKRNYLHVAGNLNFGWSDVREDDKELYFKTYEEKRAWLEKILDTEDIDEAFLGVKEIAEKCNVTLSDAKHYPSFENAPEKLRELAETGKTTAYVENSDISVTIKADGIAGRYGTLDEKKRSRFEYEMEVITKMGFASYFLFIADVISVCKNARKGALDIGPGRGSGAGSIVCYLCNITEIEPLSQELLFERFLNPHRVSMPDIDTDFSKFAREYAINYVTNKYGSHAVAGIMTKTKMGAKSALTYAPKLYAMEQGLDRMAYSELGAKIRKIVGDEDIDTMMDELTAELEGNEDAWKIIEIAQSIGGYMTSYGQHAAGLIAIQQGAVEDFIPLMMATDAEGNEKLVIQADMVQAEAQLGFIKFDFLGLKNLNVITRAMELIKERRGVELNPYKFMPEDSRVYENIFANGNTNFVFQFESDGMKDMLKKLHPTKFADIVLAVSVYRPGPMDFIPDIIDAKNTGRSSDFVTKVPILADILKETYGYPVYQEQVMQIMTIAAGFDMGHADNVRRFMSKKKEDKLAAEKPAFVSGCKENGIDAETANWLFEQLLPFAKYGFNKSHAAAYSFISFITAYLKYHYTEEYLCAVMLEQSDKTFQLQSDCKSYGITILPPDVNSSYADFTVEDEKTIRIGLSQVKGFSGASDTVVSARGNVPYRNLKDFVQRTNLKKNEYEALILAGACDSLVQMADRKAMVSYTIDLSDLLSAGREIDAKLDMLQKNPESNQLAKRISMQNDKKRANLASIERLRLMGKPTSTEERCRMEFEKLGLFLTGNPLDDYVCERVLPNFDDLDTTDIDIKADIDDLSVENVGGLIMQVRELRTKSTGAKMATFLFADKNGHMIDGVMFPKSYEKFGQRLTDGAVLSVTGMLSRDERGEQVIVESVSDLFKITGIKIISLPAVMLLPMFDQLIKESVSKQSSLYGFELLEKRSPDVIRLSDDAVLKLKSYGAIVS